MKKKKIRIYFSMNQKDKILKTIQIENYVWILYLILIGLSFYANYEEEK